jgi:(p)ppGpp synthase/HD superfamily hydrolase
MKPLNISRARKLATTWHEGQFRKYTGEKYIIHPAAVAKKLTDLGMSDDVIIAGWLHDTLEDTEIPESEIDQFGPAVVRMVNGMTNRGTGKNRAEKHLANLDHFQQQRRDVKIIRLCDIGHNMLSIIKHDPKFAATWVPEKIDYIWAMKELGFQDDTVGEYYWEVFQTLKKF